MRPLGRVNTMILKTSRSIAPWSLILSLCLLPSVPANAQDNGGEQPNPNGDGDSTQVESEGANQGEDTTGIDDGDVVNSQNESSSTNNNSSNGMPEDGSSTFDPRHQMANTKDLMAPSLQDIAAFKQSYKRYRLRINDFREETLSMVELQRQQAFETLREQYTEPRSLLEAQQEQQRATAKERFERFIAKYPEASEGAKIRFQLADIYFKDAEETFIQAQEDMMAKLDENPDLELEVRKDLSRAFELYQDIVEKFPTTKVVDGALYMMAWCYSDASSDLYDADLAATFYKRVINEHPDSRFVPQSNYFVGQYYFNKNDTETALAYFRAATEGSKPEGNTFNSLYEYANYRLAWSHYLLNDYEKALELFTDHQDYSALKEKETGRPTNTLEESYEYTALSFADVAELENKQAIEVAAAYYAANGEREYTPDVYVYLAEELIEQVRIVEAIDTYKFLQKQYPTAPENPTYQKTLAELWAQEGEEDAYMDEMRILTERYAENGEWWVANRNNPEAQDIAKGYIEASLLDVAYNQYSRAYEDPTPEAFLAAASSLERFLTRFPFAEEYYDAMWYMADSLLNAQEVSRALEQYRLLVKTSPDHQRGELAQLKILNITNALAQTRFAGEFQKLPDGEEGSIVKEVRQLTNGDSYNVYELPTEAVDFIEAYSNSYTLDYPTRTLRVEEEMAELERQAPANLDRKLSALSVLMEEVRRGKEFFDNSLKIYQYNIGQIYYSHRQYDLARQYLDLVIEGYPDSNEAAWGAGLVIASYQKELNWEQVQAQVERFLATRLGPEGEGIDAQEFTKYKRDAIVQILLGQREQADALMAEGKVEEATNLYNFTAEGFLQFLSDYPNYDQEKYANLLLMAGNIYEEGGNIEKANQVYRDYVERFPSNEASRSILFSIATNHQNALELEEAIEYFDILFKQTYGRGIEYPDAIGALFNSAVLKVGLGQYKEAAEGLEYYATRFPEQPDAEKAFFMAGEQWEKVARWRGLEFYTRYLKKYRGEDPDRTMIAHYRRIKLYEESTTSKKREIEREWDKLFESYNMMLAAGKDSPKMRQYTAEYYLREIPARLDEFKSVKYTRDDEKNAKLIQSQLAALDELRAYCAKPGEDFKDFEAVVAGRYCAGAAELYLAEFFKVYPVPENLVPGDEDASLNAQLVYEEKLAEVWEPLREGAINTLEQTIALSERQGRWTKWTQLALNDLSAIDPKAYPPQKTEALYPISSIFVAPAPTINLAYPEGMEPPVVEEEESNPDSGIESEEDASLNTTLEDEQEDGLSPQGGSEGNVDGNQGAIPSDAESDTQNVETETDLGWGTPTSTDSENTDEGSEGDQGDQGDDAQEPSDSTDDTEDTEQTTDKEDESEDQDTGDSQ